MAKREKAKDMFMNFMDLSVFLDGANTTTLVSTIVNTGLSIRGELIWLIHLVEFVFPIDALDTGGVATYQAAVSTRRGLPVWPYYDSDGLISLSMVHVFNILGAESAGGAISAQQVNHYLPPIPVAGPELVLYARTATASAQSLGKPVKARLGFTTAPLDAAAYTEIAEAWGW